MAGFEVTIEVLSQYQTLLIDKHHLFPYKLLLC
jgi:hypothetical protein